MKKIFLAILFISLFYLQALSSLANEYHDLIKVGISSNTFKRLYYSSLSIGAKKKFVIYNKKNGKELAVFSPYKWARIVMSNSKFSIYSNGNLVKKSIKGPIGIKSQGCLRVMGLKRKGKEALYRGEFELTEAFTAKNRFNLINILPMRDYLKGVVPNEIPVSFGLEAVKAQAVAARNYTLRPRVKVFHNFDVCDTVQSQVYFGANTEMNLANQAIEETEGLFALHNGEVILALYSSTAGGHTENFENVFSSPCCNEFPSVPLPYLVGKPDFPLDKKIVLSEDVYAKSFYSSAPKSFDDKSKYYRWEREWTRQELERTLRKTLASYSNTGFISPKFINPSEFGSLRSLKVLSRGVSGKAIAIEIKTNKGTWVVKKELIIRRVFKKMMKSLPSANIVIVPFYDKNGSPCRFKFIGGGFGHGVGMSQYGAGAMACSGYKFYQILQHYYTGVSIGTYPVEVSAEPIKIKFSSPDEIGFLRFENHDMLESFEFKINNVEINLGKDVLMGNGVLKLSKYIKKKNIIEFLPLAESNKKLKVWVEVYKAKK